MNLFGVGGAATSFVVDSTVEVADEVEVEVFAILNDFVKEGKEIVKMGSHCY